jgi:hypothetical protein
VAVAHLEGVAVVVVHLEVAIAHLMVVARLEVAVTHLPEVTRLEVEVEVAHLEDTSL